MAAQSLNLVYIQVAPGFLDAAHPIQKYPGLQHHILMSGTLVTGHRVSCLMTCNVHVNVNVPSVADGPSTLCKASLQL
jgi:hypothetical protein